MHDTRLDIHNSEVPVVCRACEARHRGVCGALTPDQLLHLSRHTTRAVIPAEQNLFPTDRKAHRYANIMSGVVKLSKLMADGRQQIVGLQFAPDFLGRPFVAENDIGTEAATDVRVCSFPRTVLDDMIARSPELEHRLHEQALRELDDAREWMLTLGRKSAAEKVASFILMIALHNDPEAEAGTEPFELPLKRADIADFLGLTIETVSRQITKLRKAGVIHLENNRSVTVPDLGRLQRVAGA